MKGTMDHRSTTRAVHRRVPSLIATLLLGASMVLAGPSAVAKKDDSLVKDVDTCKKTSVVKLRAVDAGNGVIQVSASVFSEDDDTWDWRMRHNGDLSYKGTVKAKDADRSFRIVREMADFSGVDDIAFRAQNNATNEICSLAIEY